MGYTRSNPHAPTSMFQVGDRVMVVGACSAPNYTSPEYGALGTVVSISAKTGDPIVNMDKSFCGAMYHPGNDMTYNNCCVFKNGDGLELVCGIEKFAINSIEDLM